MPPRARVTEDWKIPRRQSMREVMRRSQAEADERVQRSISISNNAQAQATISNEDATEEDQNEENSSPGFQPVTAAARVKSLRVETLRKGYQETKTPESSKRKQTSLDSDTGTSAAKKAKSSLVVRFKIHFDPNKPQDEGLASEPLRTGVEINEEEVAISDHTMSHRDPIRHRPAWRTGPVIKFTKGSRTNPVTFTRPARAVEELRAQRVYRMWKMRCFNEASRGSGTAKTAPESNPRQGQQKPEDAAEKSTMGQSNQRGNQEESPYPYITPYHRQEDNADCYISPYPSYECQEDEDGEDGEDDDQYEDQYEEYKGPVDQYGNPADWAR